MKVLAISSGGGHWVQLLRLRPALAGCEVVLATVRDGYRADAAGAEFHVVPDCHRWDKLAVLRCALVVLGLVCRVRPDVVLTTGAAPGYLAARVGRWFGARVIWVDSVANADHLSLSGQKAGAIADLWLTQWPHLACEGGPQYLGSVL